MAGVAGGETETGDTESSGSDVLGPRSERVLALIRRLPLEFEED
jgi:hypothetical protein